MATISQQIQDQMAKLKGRTAFKPFLILTKSGKNFLVSNAMQYAVTDNLVAYASDEESRIIHIAAEDFEGIRFIDEKPAA